LGVRVMLIGLDSVPPSLAFERYLGEMPNLAALMARGAHARLRSTLPPITVPAWTAMVSGRDPGELGLYGFRLRRDAGYELSLATGDDVRAPRVWDVLGEHGKRSSVLFVPPSFPPRPVRGEQVSCFLTPEGESCSFPRQLQGELAARFGTYVPDVEVRHAAREGLPAALERMTEQHFAMAEHVWRTREPDFLMMVAIGPDRLHHAFLADIDPAHPRHDPEGPFREVGLRYYRLLDRLLGRMITLAGEDTAVLVASDHGVRPLDFAFCINEWLRREGYLVLRESPASAGPLRPAEVDWSRTRAWAEGGYYARVFLNVAGRELSGIVRQGEYEALRAELTEKLRAVPDRAGKPMNNRVEAPAQLYRRVEGRAPDLLAIFADLAVRPLSTVGGELYADGDDRGADACNHDWDGIFVLAGPGVSARGELPLCSIHDVGMTALGLCGVPAPAGWLGTDRSRS
jgi:predicted AlkP superfamily phosphohydrolase/phosphomutase